MVNKTARISVAIVVAVVGIANVLCLAQGPFGFERGMTKKKVIELVGLSAIVDSGSIKGFPTTGSEESVYSFAPEDEDTITYLIVTTAPKPHAAFKSYSLKFYSGYGLMKVIANTPTIEAGANGDNIMAKFEEISTKISSSGSRPDLRVSSGMTTSNALEIVWKIQDWRNEFVKGNRTMERTWEWECKPNQSFIKEFYKKFKTLPPSDQRFSCGSIVSTGYPQLFFLSNRVSKIELQAEISNEHNGRVFLIYGFDGEEQLEEAISRRAEDFHSQ